MNMFCDEPSFFRWLHTAYRPRTYVEVGVGAGELLALARGAASVGIDAGADIRHPIPRATKLFPVDAAAFFARHDLVRELDGQCLDVGVVRTVGSADDGRRTFAELERAGAADTLIVAAGPTGEWVRALADRRRDVRVAAVAAGPTELFLIRASSAGGGDPSPLVCPATAAAVKEFLALKPYQGRAAWRRRRPTGWRRRLAGAARRLVWQPIGAMARLSRRRPRALGVLLCYNDADILADAIEWLAANDHDVLAWDHGSDDNTAAVLDAYHGVLVERRFVPRDFDFYQLYPAMSAHLRENYVGRYDWISWPDQDELLEGPWRDRTYYEYVTDVFNSPFDWVQFNNYNYWFTTEDDPRITAPARRVRRYSLFPDCAPRIRCWRARATNVRQFNHNPPAGRRFPLRFNLRHYSMRTEAQMLRRIAKDRSDLQRGDANYHYANMKAAGERLYIPAQALHFDDGRSDLNPDPVFDWRGQVYGHQAPAAPSLAVAVS